MSDKKSLYEGEFLTQNGDIEVKQIEDNDKTTVKIIRSNPSLSNIKNEPEQQQQPISSSSTSSSSESLSTSGMASGSGSESTLPPVKTEKKSSEFEKDEKKEFLDLHDIYIKEEPENGKQTKKKRKERKNDGQKKPPNFYQIKEKYISFLEYIGNDFMNLFHILCDKKSNNGIIHAKITEKLLDQIFGYEKDKKDEIKNYLLDLQLNTNLIDEQFFSAIKNQIFVDNYKKLSTDTKEDWYIKINYDKKISPREEDNFYNYFNNVYFSYVLQCINHMIINRKLNMHHITERFLIECIFSVVKLMVFPNVGESITATQLYTPVKTRDFELEFLGRNVWLRQAWTLYISVLYSENKKYALKEDVDDDENAFYLDDLRYAYEKTFEYYWKNIYMKMNESMANKPIILKIKNEYENALGVMNMSLYCIKLYYLYRDFNNFDYDIFHRITHAAWLFPKYRSDLEQCDISDDLKNMINVFNYKSLYEDAKHLHSFRASRTFGTEMPEKYWQSFDPQDSAACIKHDSILQEVCFDIANFFGLYESHNADFIKPQSEVDRLKEILYAKVLNLRSTIASEKDRYMEYMNNDDIPDYEKRRLISDLNIDLSDKKDIDEEQLIKDLKWIKINMDNPRSVFVKIDDNILENFEEDKLGTPSEASSSSLNNVNLIKYDKNVKIQKRKMISFDQLGSDIKIAQSLLRYFEQLFNLFFMEARN